VCCFYRPGSQIQAICIHFFKIASLMGGRALRPGQNEHRPGDPRVAKCQSCHFCDFSLVDCVFFNKKTGFCDVFSYIQAYRISLMNGCTFGACLRRSRALTASGFLDPANLFMCLTASFWSYRADASSLSRIIVYRMSIARVSASSIVYPKC